VNDKDRDIICSLFRAAVVLPLAIGAAALIAALWPVPAHAADPRVCGTVQRTSDGRIKRSSTVLREFRRLHPCPADPQAKGACPGWAIDHVVPLACGGCDAVVNLQWLPIEAKSASGTLPKDRWERDVYCGRRP
jgi:hypothetical protein